MNKDPIVRLSYYIQQERGGVKEIDPKTWFAAHPEDKPELYDQFGLIYLIYNGQEAIVGDQLLSVIQIFCFDAVVNVLKNGVANFSLWSADTGVQLTIKGENIEILSNVFVPVTFPKWQLLKELVALGEEFLKTAPTIWGEDDPYNDVLVGEYYKERAKAAREALNTALSRS